jgi:O-antigen/teichoic acid export membrane protein
MSSRVLEIRGAQLARNTALNLVGYVVPILVGVAVIPYLVRGLGADRFGVLSLAWVLLGYISLFDLGLGRATTKFVAECLGRGEPERLPSLVWTSVGLQLLFGLIGALLVAAATPLLADRLLKIPPALLGETRTTFFILAASLPIVLATNGFRGVLEAGQHFDLVNYVKVPANVSVFLLPAIGVAVGLHLPGIVFLLVLARLAATFAYLAFCLRVFPRLRQRFSLDWGLLGPLGSYGGWVTVSNVVGPLVTYMDRFLIGSILSLAAVTYYTAPYEAITRVWIFPTSLVATLFPAFSTLSGGGDGERLARLYARSVKSLLLVLGPLLLLVAVYASTILRLWLGADFAQQSSLVLQVLAIGVLINSLAFVPYGLLQGLGRPDLTAKFHLLEFPIYAVMAWFLIRWMGIRGAAIAWTVRVALDALLLFGATFRLRFISPRGLIESGVLKSALAVIAFGVVFLVPAFARGAVLTHILFTVSVVSLFGLATWSFLLDKGEKALLAQTLARVLTTLSRAK